MCTQCFPHMTCQINKPLVQIFFDVVAVLELNNKFLLPPKEFGPNLYRQQRRNRRLRHNFSKHLKMVEVPIPLNYSVIRRMCLLIVDFQQQQVRKWTLWLTTSFRCFWIWTQVWRGNVVDVVLPAWEMTVANVAFAWTSQSLEVEEH